jgi:serine/threonine-protein kinase
VREQTGSLDRSGLPSEWKRQAVRRLTQAAGIALVASTLALLVSFARQKNVGVHAGSDRPSWPMIVGIVGALGMLLVSRAQGLRAQRKLDVGLGFLVLFSFLAAVFRHGLPYHPSDVLRGFSPVAFCVLFFAIFVPVSPKRMAVGGVAASLTDPLALGLNIHADHPTPPWNLWLWLFLPNLVSVAIAVVSSHLLYQIGRSVTQARQMGAYRLIQRLGVGGMGEVWRAEHRILARPAAIKLIRPEALGAADPESRAVILRRFEREAQATAMLNSPHTIDVFDFGVSQDGSFYYVMELLDGMNLDEVLAVSGRLPTPRAVHLLEQICQSLRDAHHAGMVHRDIKPANIFVCRRGMEWDYVKVLDFGLVKQIDAEATQITMAGGIAGTPAYMAPEAARGQEVDPLADLYAVGCVGYRLLAGQEVFPGKSALELLFAHAEQSPEPLARHAAPDVPEALTALIMRCLEKRPEDRPASGGELLRGLQATGLAARWTAADAEAWWTRQRAAAAEPDRGGDAAAANAVVAATALASASSSASASASASAPTEHAIASESPSSMAKSEESSSAAAHRGTIACAPTLLPETPTGLHPDSLASAPTLLHDTHRQDNEAGKAVNPDTHRPTRPPPEDQG